MTKAELVAAMADKTGLNRVQATSRWTPSSLRSPPHFKAGKEVRVVVGAQPRC